MKIRFLTSNLFLGLFFNTFFNIILCDPTQAAVKLNFSVTNGNTTAHPQITTNFGMPVSISYPIKGSTDSLELVAVPLLTPAKGESPAFVTLEMELSRLSEGQRTLLAQPKVTTLFGEKASISQQSEQNELIEIAIVPSLID
jgi:hypothetical protein